MAIRIERNEAGNAVSFHGSSQPTYHNACLSGQVNSQDSNTVNIRNDIRSTIDSDHYEFFQIPFTDFVDADGNSFASAQEAADYITDVCNVIGESGSGIDMAGQPICFKLDDTSTSIMTDHGYSFGVNTIKAVLAENNLIEIVSNDHSNSLVRFKNLDPANVCINDAPVSGGPQDVVNAANELFTVGAFESVVIADPYSTMVADVGGVDITYTLEGTTAVDPVGDDIFGNSSSGNLAGLKSVETIDQVGEYFTLQIRNEGQIGFGLIHSDASYASGYYSGSATYADPSTFAVTNSAHSGFQFSHFFHGTPNGSWTQYGASTGFVRGSGWSSWDQQQDWLDGNPVTIRCGLDENGFIAISSLQNDGSWTMHARSSYPVPEGSEFHLGVKASSSVPRVYLVPHVHLLEPAAPNPMTFRYIESPDGYYTYPLFSSQEQADYYELIESGSDNGSVAMVFEDDAVAGTTWYMPATSNQQQYGLTPVEDGVTTFQSNTINWTEISSLNNTQMVPEAYTAQTVTVNELASVNIPTQPQDTGYITTFQNVPAGLLDLGDGSLIGTAPEVTGDNVANPSDDYPITVTRTNNYGASTGTLTLTVTNLTAPVVVPITGFTHEATSTALVDADTMDAGSVVSIDETVNTDKRFIIPKTWVESYVLPALQGAGDHVILGIADTPDWTDGADSGDYNLAIKWEYASASSHTVSLIGTSTTTYTVASLTSSIFDYAIEVDTSNNLWAIGCNVNSINTEPAVADGGSFTHTQSGTSGTAPYTLHLGVVDSQMDLSATELTEIDVPSTPSSLTTWSKALDFSGSEYAKHVNNSMFYQPLQMAGLANLVPAHGTLGYTANNSSSRPWATVVVFKSDGYSGNQMIWNQGEGSVSGNDNIFVNVTANGTVNFGWGREGTGYNQCQILTNISPSTWYAVYVAHSGERLGGGAATASALADCFDIRTMSSADSFASLSSNLSITANWVVTGYRMDRTVAGDFTVGGRGTGYSFRGKVASMITHCLKAGVPMQDATEIELMITDPLKWEADYLIGNSYRRPTYSNSSTNYQKATSAGFEANQMWFMGDGTPDTFPNINNEQRPNWINYTYLVMTNMVSNDIQNVTIDGLS